MPLGDSHLTIMTLDRSRQYDLEELHALRRKAVNATEREMYDHTIGSILRESGATRSLREDLIKAVRADDIRSIKRLNWELRKIRANETGGHDY